MKISELKITHEEVIIAVKQWLDRQGLVLPVVDVRRPYSWDDYIVDLDLGEKEPPAPKDETPITPAL
jgi:hypothetical protein